MDTLALLANRQSLRIYDDRPVPLDVRRAVLEAAISAPTAGALMLYAIIEIEEEALKAELAVTCDNQPFIAKAPWVALFAADYQRLYDGWRIQGKTPSRKPGAGDLLLACDDALIAAQTAVIAAEAMGLGSCYIGDIMENAERHQAMLKLPDYVFPAVLLCFGYPPEGYTRKKVPRLPLEAVLHTNEYHTKPTAGGDHAQLLIDRSFSKYEAPFSVEMTRSMERWLERWKG